MTPFEACQTYEALKLHFSSPGYDFWKYNGKFKMSREAFDKRRDRFWFEKLTKRYPVKENFVDFVIANLIHYGDKVVWSDKLMLPESDEIYRKHLGKLEAFQYHFKQDIEKFLDYCEASNQFPNHVMDTFDSWSFETILILDVILGAVLVSRNTTGDDILWPKFYQRALKYQKYLHIKLESDLPKIIEYLRDRLKIFYSSR